MPAVLHYALAIFFIWLLAGAAWHKIRYPAYASERLRSYLPPITVSAPVLVAAIAGIELLLALGMALPATRHLAFLGTAFLLTAYLAGMIRQFASGAGDMRCGCAGPDSDLRIGPALILRNSVLVLLATAGYLPVTHPASGGVFYFNALLAGLFLIGACLCIEQLMLNAQRLQAGRE